MSGPSDTLRKGIVLLTVGIVFPSKDVLEILC